MRTELVTTLKRQATEILNQLEKDREPILITQHGVPSAYLVDVQTLRLYNVEWHCSKALLAAKRQLKKVGHSVINRQSSGCPGG